MLVWCNRMAFQTMYQELIDDGSIVAMAIIDITTGNITWTTDNWAIDSHAIMQAWSQRAPSIVVQGVKYSTLQVLDDRFIGTSIKGHGHLLLAKCPTSFAIVAWSPSNQEARGAFTGVAKLAASYQ